MDIKDMNMEQVEARISEMQAELETEGADIEKLNAEFEELRSRKKAILQEAQEKRTLLDKIANSKEEPIAKMEERKETNMETIEVRNTPEYIEAYAKYIKTGDASECRAALKTENASGTIAVPELVWDTVKTAWNRDGVMALVRKAYLKGNLKVGFEISSSEAVAHTEGVAVDEENLVLGVVNLVPQAIKKWINRRVAFA